MAKKFEPQVSAHKNQLESQFAVVWLYEFQDNSDPPRRFRMTEWTERITYRGNTYYPQAISHGGFVQSSEGDLPTIDIAIASTSLEVATVLENSDGLVGNPAKIILLDLETSTTPPRELRGELIGVSLDHEKVVATIGMTNPFRRRFPGNIFSRRKCRFTFGDARCGYDITSGNYNRCGTQKDDTVDAPAYTFNACAVIGDDEVANGFTRQHPKRFGGFPAIKPARRF